MIFQVDKIQANFLHVPEKYRTDEMIINVLQKVGGLLSYVTRIAPPIISKTRVLNSCHTDTCDFLTFFKPKSGNK